MGMQRLAAFRDCDFTAGLWFKPAAQGGLTQPSYCMSLRRLFIRFGDRPPFEVRLAAVGEWARPGQGLRCGIGVKQWADTDRRMIDVGTSFEVLSALAPEYTGPPACIGLGRVIELGDPDGRRFVADALVSVDLEDENRPFDTLAGTRTYLRFPRLAQQWEGHFDETPPSKASTVEPTKRWLCFHDLWRSYRLYPGAGHPILAGDEFEIIENETPIGKGCIAEWAKGQRVCFPKGWRTGSGVEWRTSWSG